MPTMSVIAPNSPPIPDDVSVDPADGGGGGGGAANAAEAAGRVFGGVDGDLAHGLARAVALVRARRERH